MASRLDKVTLETLYEQNRVVIIKLHYLELENKNLARCLLRLIELNLRLLDDPQAREEIAATIKEFGVGEGTTVKTSPK